MAYFFKPKKYQGKEAGMVTGKKKIMSRSPMRHTVLFLSSVRRRVSPELLAASSWFLPTRNAGGLPKGLWRAAGCRTSGRKVMESCALFLFLQERPHQT